MWSGIITGALLLIFVAGWLWAWSPRRKAGFDAAARLALEGNRAPVDTTAHAGEAPTTHDDTAESRK